MKGTISWGWWRKDCPGRGPCTLSDSAVVTSCGWSKGWEGRCGREESGRHGRSCMPWWGSVTFLLELAGVMKGFCARVGCDHVCLLEWLFSPVSSQGLVFWQYQILGTREKMGWQCGVLWRLPGRGIWELVLGSRHPKEVGSAGLDHLAQSPLPWMRTVRPTDLKWSAGW